MAETRFYSEKTQDIDLAWLMRQDTSPDTHSILTDLSRALGVIIVLSLILHLAKNL